VRGGAGAGFGLVVVSVLGLGLAWDQSWNDVALAIRHGLERGGGDGYMLCLAIGTSWHEDEREPDQDGVAHDSEGGLIVPRPSSSPLGVL